MPTRSPRIETQAFVYFNADDPEIEIEPIIISGDEADLRSAVQALYNAGLILEKDAEKYINPPLKKPLKNRLREWRKRNGPR